MATPVKLISDSTFAKLELLNLGGSHKARAARQMIVDAEREGRIRPGSVILEKTGGNLGIGLAMEANRRGYPLHLVVNIEFSELKKKILRAYGAKLVGTDYLRAGLTTRQAVEKLRSEGSSQGIDYVFLDQFANPSNLAAHLLTTGPEFCQFVAQISNSTNDKICLVGGIGTGASLTGIGRSLKSNFRDVEIYAVQPEGVDFVRGVYGVHGIQGTGVATPPLMDFSLVHEYIPCSMEQAFAARNWLVQKQGILCGLSSAANVHAARVLEHRLSATHRGRYFVLTVIYDGGESYLDDQM